MEDTCCSDKLGLKNDPRELCSYSNALGVCFEFQSVGNHCLVKGLFCYYCTEFLDASLYERCEIIPLCIC